MRDSAERLEARLRILQERRNDASAGEQDES
jgi:hypothetical protein